MMELAHYFFSFIFFFPFFYFTRSSVRSTRAMAEACGVLQVGVGAVREVSSFGLFGVGAVCEASSFGLFGVGACTQARLAGGSSPRAADADVDVAEGAFAEGGVMLTAMRPAAGITTSLSSSSLLHRSTTSPSSTSMVLSPGKKTKGTVKV